jgi:hypothetical protein
VSVPTSFRWRHRFPSCAKDAKAKMLTGIARTDETFFPKSFKGIRKLGRRRANEAARP